jgi:hypothetical protein
LEEDKSLTKEVPQYPRGKYRAEPDAIKPDKNIRVFLDDVRRNYEYE